MSLSGAFCLGAMRDQASSHDMMGGQTLEELRDAVREAESEVQACDPTPESSCEPTSPRLCGAKSDI